MRLGVGPYLLSFPRKGIEGAKVGRQEEDWGCVSSHCHFARLWWRHLQAGTTQWCVMQEVCASETNLFIESFCCILSNGSAKICWALNVYKCGLDYNIFSSLNHSQLDRRRVCSFWLLRSQSVKRVATASSGGHKCSIYRYMQQIVSHTLFCSVKYGAPEHVVYTFDGVICSFEWKKRAMDVVCTASERRPFSEPFTCMFFFFFCHERIQENISSHRCVFFLFFFCFFQERMLKAIECTQVCL